MKKMKSITAICSLSLLLFSCMVTVECEQDKQEKQIRDKMDELRQNLSDMQEKIDREMKEMDSLQKSLDSFPLK